MTEPDDEDYTEKEIRCPVGPRRLFGIMLQRGEQPHITGDNLIEMACSDCKRSARQRNPHVSLVVHLYDLAGDLVDTDVVER